MTEANQNTQPERAFLISEAGERYRVSPSTIWRYVSLRMIHTIHVGKRIIIPAGEIARIDREGLPSISRKMEREIMAQIRAEKGAA